MTKHGSYILHFIVICIIPRPGMHQKQHDQAWQAHSPEGMVSLVKELVAINPLYGIWLASIHLSIHHFEGLSLHHQSLNIHPVFFEPLTDPNDLLI
jgi:hypothetical protein